MQQWTSWELVLLGTASYIAATALVRMMRARRDAILDDLDRQAQAAAEERRVAERRDRKRRFRQQMIEQKKNKAA